MIKRATAAHAFALAKVHREAFPEREAWGPDAFSLQLGIPGVFALLDPSGGLILVRVAGEEAEVLTLAVAPAVQRLGIGSLLLRSAMSKARQAGAASMVLEVSVSNEPARRLYQAAGFHGIGERRNYYPDGSDALILRTEL
ncbi:MAG: ribosomal protein S18-alanine N-acetyltransferase [Acetobacteraceae bacterium]|nr:ribosomal protein S18-alanine N-acetyltransferase [Acetobacteraceae bacterium]